MAKDYFQDIVPPQNKQTDKQQKVAVRTPVAKVPTPPTPELEEIQDDPIPPAEPYASERSIRNINVPQRSVRPMRPSVTDPRMSDTRDSGNYNPPPQNLQQMPPKPRRPRSSHWWIWIIVLICILALGAFAFFAFRKTTVTVIPRSHTSVFDQSSQFVAYPAATAATGTLAYTVVNSSLQDSEAVPAQGTQQVSLSAQGTIMVYNDYSTTPIKLIKNTRFETPDGLIFRIQKDLVVPGKQDTSPGSVSATIVADQPGAQYNIPATPRFTVPGLQNDAAMYSNVYAQSTASTTGGFVGTQPVADPATVQNAQADLRSQLEQQARTAAAAQNGTSTTVFADLMQITYQDLPSTPQANGELQINEQASIAMPVFDAESFAQAVAQNVSADATGAQLSLVPGQGFTAQMSSTASTTLGTDPLSFSLTGTATLVWQVDSTALSQALAGKDQSAFAMIESGFPGVQEAHARIEPFWKTTFPSNPADIEVIIEPPQTTSPSTQ
jgi:hypothetical protein